MSDIINRIHAAQTLAGEQVVLDDLHQRGLLNSQDATAVKWGNLEVAARLALKRLTELNRDDEDGIRIVLANALKALSSPECGD